jgi:hypothetical protein
LIALSAIWLFKELPHLIYVASQALMSQRGSIYIPEAHIETYRSNVYMLSEQKVPYMFGKSQKANQSSKTDYYNTAGDNDAEANDITERHSDTVLNNTFHGLRACTLRDADYADLIDKSDKIRILLDPEGIYTAQGIRALNRKKDDIFISAILGSAMSGEYGETSVALPNSQKLVCIDDSGAAFMNVYALTLVQLKLELAENIEDGMRRYLAWSPYEKQALLNTTQATSSDYAAVKALVNGQINTFMGFEFITTNRLPVTLDVTYYDDETGEVLSSNTDQTLAAGATRCVAWIEDGMLSAIGEEIFVDVGPRRDKRVSTQVYLRHSVGAVRLEEEKVVELIVKRA